MPCWNVITTQVSIGVIKNKDRFTETATELGYRVLHQGDTIILTKGYDSTITIRGETATVTGPNQDKANEIINKLKSAYTVRTLMDGAKRFGWRQQTLPQMKAGRTKITLIR
jgi:hypothetical protein